MLSLSASCTSIKSPGLNIWPPIPELKFTISLSCVSVSKWYLPTLCACDSEVHPYATVALDTILPVSAIFYESSTNSTACL